MRRSESQRLDLFSRGRRLAAIPIAIVLALPLAGCLLDTEQIAAAINIPKAYRAGPRNADAALPSVDAVAVPSCLVDGKPDAKAHFEAAPTDALPEREDLVRP